MPKPLSPQRAVIILRDDEHGGFTANITFEPSIKDRTVNSPAANAALRLASLIRSGAPMLGVPLSPEALLAIAEQGCVRAGEASQEPAAADAAGIVVFSRPECRFEYCPHPELCGTGCLTPAHPPAPSAAPSLETAEALADLLAYTRRHGLGHQLVNYAIRALGRREVPSARPEEWSLEQLVTARRHLSLSPSPSSEPELCGRSMGQLSCIRPKGHEGRCID